MTPREDPAAGAAASARLADAVADAVEDAVERAGAIGIDATVVRAFANDDWMARTSRAIAESPLGTLGGYRIERVVARGAQGVVYEAREARTGRRVAIKRLPSDDGGSVEAARFAREAETLASLAHPHVVALLAAPIDEGSRLIVMEWIDGEPFDLWADRIWSSRPHADATTCIVRTVGDIAAAVAAAHLRGVMHRDLKPSNVLVTASGEAKVLDFGLAKALAGTPLVTRTGGFAGTPGWASPEQVAGRPEELDARTDVHALGLLLYRGLAGRTAFDTDLPILPLFEAIRTETPTAPSRLRDSIPRELDLIALRALEKDPVRRYQSAEAFARDLSRYLAAEPIDAHPPSLLYATGKFVRRHRAITALAATTASAIVGGTIVSTYLAFDARDARNAAVARAAEADQARDRAERMIGFFRDLLANVREHEAAGDRAGAREIIALAAAGIERAGVPRESEADLRRTLGIAFLEIGDYARAAREYAQAAELLTDPADAVPLAQTLLAEARALDRTTRRIEAPDRARRALEVIARIDAPVELRVEGEAVLATSLVFAGRPAEALAAADVAMASARTLGATEILSQAMSTRALALELSGRLPEATEQAVEAAKLARTLPDLRPTDRARLLHNAAMMLTNADRAAEALPLAEESLAIREAHFGRGHPAATPGRSQLALTLRALGRLDEAIALHEATIAALDETTSESLLLRGNARRHLARSLELRNGPGDEAEAIRCLRTSLVELARSGTAHSNPMFSASRSLLRSTIAKAGREAALLLAVDFGDELSRTSANPIAGPIFRSELPRELQRTAGSEPWIPNPEWIARFRADLDAVQAIRAGNEEVTLRVELALGEALAMTATEVGHGEARMRIGRVRDVALATFGESSSLVAACDAALRR